jgi:hypothetical protein
VKLLDEALGRIKPYLIDRLNSEEGWTSKDKNYLGPDDHGWVNGSNGDPNVAFTMLRMDMELADKTLSVGETADLLVDLVKLDLEDLIEDGDIANTSDALLKSFDGSKKRGLAPVEVDIFSAGLYWEHVKSKEITEYTLYMNLYVRWDDTVMSGNTKCLASNTTNF